MGTTVNEVRIEDFTDASGRFHVGMKREAASQMRNSLFHNYEKEFDKIDTDGDGEISDRELLARMKSDVQTSKLCKTLDFVAAGVGLLTTCFGKGKKNKIINGACAALFGVVGISMIKDEKSLKQKAENLEKLIQEKESLEVTPKE